ncbi:pyridoxine 5'-phosphate oxidase C-terminal domain-containing protein [Streptomyces sp. NPDC056231]|uniref:pyridoxine 5'-phosphate oxidase C-terminal domain-containing protein n=1 Tax=Streptomyces sp. NPDC056231 TaxID=3345755 RepID=UPI003AAB1F11
MEASLTQIKNEPDLVAPGWTLYSVRPESVEFWQGDKQRRHTRLVYLPSTGGPSSCCGLDSYPIHKY